MLVLQDKVIPTIIYSLFIAWGLELRVLCLPGKCSTTELYLQLSFHTFHFEVWSNKVARAGLELIQ